MPRIVRYALRCSTQVGNCDVNAVWITARLPSLVKDKNAEEVQRPSLRSIHIHTSWLFGLSSLFMMRPTLSGLEEYTQNMTVMLRP